MHNAGSAQNQSISVYIFLWLLWVRPLSQIWTSLKWFVRCRIDFITLLSCTIGLPHFFKMAFNVASCDTWKRWSIINIVAEQKLWCGSEQWEFLTSISIAIFRSDPSVKQCIGTPKWRSYFDRILWTTKMVNRSDNLSAIMMPFRKIVLTCLTSYLTCLTSYLTCLTTATYIGLGTNNVLNASKNTRSHKVRSNRQLVVRWF
jgi:hypothetical protein